MRRKFGITMMIIGLMLLLGALALFLYNQHQDKRAGEEAAKHLSEIKKIIADEKQKITAEPTLAPGVSPTPMPIPSEWGEGNEGMEAPRELKEVTVDGHTYIGYITIPSIELELPVLTSWSYKLLDVAPCRYSGDYYSGNLVIAGHNYYHHFNPIHGLKQGTEVIFTDMEDQVHRYVVDSHEIMTPGLVKDMKESPYELTLFTCTYGGKTRRAVRCREVKDN